MQGRWWDLKIFLVGLEIKLWPTADQIHSFRTFHQNSSVTLHTFSPLCQTLFLFFCGAGVYWGIVFFTYQEVIKPQ